MQQTNSMKRNNIKKIIKITSTLIAAIVIALATYTITNQDIINNQSYQIQTYGIYGIFIASFLLDLIPQFASPVIILTAAIFANINITTAVLITILGSTTGSILGFVIGKKYMCKAVNLTISQTTAQKISHLTNKYGKIIVPITAISPLPYLPILLGAMNFSKQNFIIYGLIPRALSFIIYGHFLQVI